MKHTHQRYCLLALGLAVLMGCGREEAPTVNEVPRVKFFEVGEQSGGQLRRLSGKLVAEDESRLSFSVPGTVEEVLVVQGQAVQAGELLARLETQPKRIAVDQAQASLTVARANKIETKQTLERMSELAESDFVSRADLEAAQAADAAASGNLRAAESELERKQRDLSRTELTAPFAGSIASRSVDPFQEVASGQEVFVLQSEQVLKVEVQVPETLIRFVDYGQLVQVTFSSLPDERLQGTISEIGSRAASGNAFPVSIQVANTGLDLRSGMTAAVTFNFDSYIDERPVYLIPLAALALDYVVIQRAQLADREQASPWVFVVGDDGRIQVRELVTGDLRGDMLEVFQGLEPGEKVVSAGVSFLREGMSVELWTEEQGLTRG